MLEWQDGDGFTGVRIGGKVWFFITETMFRKRWVIWSPDSVANIIGRCNKKFNTSKEAKDKAEELLGKWMKEVNLIVKPTKCNQCDDRGFHWDNGSPDECNCVSDTDSYYSFKKTMDEPC